MVVLEKKPELGFARRSQAELRLDRTDILFHDLDGHRVRIEVTVHNEGVDRSPPTLMKIESAPLGAFVPWTPLAQLPVPALEPGESRELRTEVLRPRPAPVGDFNRVPPKKLLTAISSSDQSSPSSAGFPAWLNLLRRGQSGRPSGRDVAGTGSLAPDLWDWVRRGQPHWAGNINIFVGRRPVERHLARALRVYPGRTNLAMFLVGNPRTRDAFAFELVGLSPDWKAALYDATNRTNLLVDSSDTPIRTEQWVESNGGLMVMLATQPPADCSAGSLEVHVMRRGTPTPAIVEFNLDPMAQGAGCYFV